ncbi:LuxR C-terminal-related transcriptional regulator [Brachybacterium sp. AOP43-C2-M15]|uniref:LuxR C-terminal-related transcriptional regulator n=1 Tax=Brachybacterium sp. AOP43-C2-M15 TaxID=3457661 RepID=UPI004033FE3F
MIRLVVADDQAILRSGLVALLRLETDLEVVGEAADGAGTLAAVADHRPDVLLLDVQMPPGTTAEGAAGPEDGIAVAERLNSGAGDSGAGDDEGPVPRIIVLTTFGRAGYLRRTMEAGAQGFMVKDTPVERLVDAIRRVHQGMRVVDPELAAQSLAVGPSPLTAKETEVLQATAAGGTTADIARSLFLSEGTVRNHLSAVIGKLGVSHRAEAVRTASENGWI